jgi:aromatic ring-cleaving dioxygenase
MADDDAPYHAHAYFAPEHREAAVALRSQLATLREVEGTPVFIGQLRDHGVGPHPIPQFEVHFPKRDLARLMPVFEGCGLSVLVHPVTLDDFADHTTLATWVGEPIALDVSVLDPPGINQGLARFGRTDA